MTMHKATEPLFGFVSIIGRPNVGKSTLLNQVLGEKVSIVTDKPQTTRNRILGIYNDAEAQIVLLDTPGIHQAKGGLNKRMVQTALATLDEIDLVLFLVPPNLEFGTKDSLITDHLKEIKTPKVLVVNKIDSIKQDQIIPVLQAYSESGIFSDVIPISALTGKNVTRLLDISKQYLPEGVPLFPDDIATDQPLRFLASEIIREKLIIKTRNEVPYAIAVKIESFKEDARKNLTKIQATLYVERNSQKGILIGKKGQLLKEVGQSARIELEKLLATKIFLELWVKVRKNWRTDDLFLTDMNY